MPPEGNKFSCHHWLLRIYKARWHACPLISLLIVHQVCYRGPFFGDEHMINVLIFTRITLPKRSPLEHIWWGVEGFENTRRNKDIVMPSITWRTNGSNKVCSLMECLHSWSRNQTIEIIELSTQINMTCPTHNHICIEKCYCSLIVPWRPSLSSPSMACRRVTLGKGPTMT